MLLATKFRRGSAPVAAGCLGSPISEATQHVVDGAMMQAWAENMQLLQTLSNMWHHIISQIKWDEARSTSILSDTIGYYQHQQTAPKWGITKFVQLRLHFFGHLGLHAESGFTQTKMRKHGTTWHQYGINMRQLCISSHIYPNRIHTALPKVNHGALPGRILCFLSPWKNESWKTPDASALAWAKMSQRNQIYSEIIQISNALLHHVASNLQSARVTGERQRKEIAPFPVQECPLPVTISSN
jgi:hypothetical protein